MKRILITGFEPFSEFQVNPSKMIVERLQEELGSENNLKIESSILPVEYSAVDEWIEKQDFSRFDFVFHFGLASGRNKISLERVALNWMESKIPDNAGVHMRGQRIADTAADALLSPFHLSETAIRLNQKYKENIEVSFSAGAYLCNFVYYKSRQKIDSSLFIHLPQTLKSEGQEYSYDQPEYAERVFVVVRDALEMLISQSES